MNYDATSQRMDDSGKLIFRLALGILMLFHGVAKLLHGIEPIEGMLVANELPAALAYGVYIGEILAPVLVILGYYARISAGIIVINMLFAVFLAHSTDLLSLTAHGGWRLELQGMYLFGALALLLMGPGRYSVNHC